MTCLRVCLSTEMKFHVFVLILRAMGVILFEQSDYKIIKERITLDWYNTDYVKDAKVILYHYTRYEKRVNVSMTILQDLGNDITQTGQAYKFQSNEYREFPVLYKSNICDDLKSDKFGTSEVHYNTNFIGCPIRKGFYYAVNVYLNERKFPPFAPRGRFMWELTTYFKNTILLARIQSYFAIEPTNPLERVITG